MINNTPTVIFVNGANITEKPLPQLSTYTSENKALDYLREYISFEIMSFVEAFIDKSVDWERVNNLLFLDDMNGQFNPNTGYYTNASDLGREAVSDAELLLVKAIFESVKTFKSLAN